MLRQHTLGITDFRQILVNYENTNAKNKSTIPYKYYCINLSSFKDVPTKEYGYKATAPNISKPPVEDPKN